MLDVKHGGQFLSDGAQAVLADASVADRLAAVVTSGTPPETTPFDYLFPQLKTKPDAHLPGPPAQVATNLDALGTAMSDPSPALDRNSTIPAVYIYWGQFIDHDMTANTGGEPKTSDIRDAGTTGPVPPDEVIQNLRNLRRPQLELDSVYGDGPAFLDPRRNDAGFYDGPRFRLGQNHVAGIPQGTDLGEKIPPVADLTRDVPRIGPLLKAGVITENDLPPSLRNAPNRDTRAFIGDSRNDENLIVAQFHVAFLRFHNKVVDRLSAPQGQGLLDELLGVLGGLFGGLLGNERARFEVARRLTRWHYQWLVVNDFLKTITLSGIVDKILIGGLKHYKPLPNRRLYMPLEYSVAAFRFGHSMIRPGYDHNRNFGNPLHPDPPPAPTPERPGRASFEQLFQFTGNGHELVANDPTRSTPNPLGGSPTLPFNWIIEWDRLTRKEDSFTSHFGKKIDTRLAALSPTAQLTAVLNMVNEGTDPGIQDAGNQPLRQLLRHLARRNLLRGYLLSIPTGQSVAAEMGVAPLTAAELTKADPADAGAVNISNVLKQGGFVENTPLWFYVLKEAEVRGDGNCLGEVGSRIVAETIIGVLRHDTESYLNAPGGWNPSKGVKLANGDPIVTIRDFLSFTGVPA